MIRFILWFKRATDIVYDTLVTKVDATDTNVTSTSRLVSNTQYNSGKKNLKKNIEVVNQKIPNISSGLVKKTDLNTKIT